MKRHNLVPVFAILALGACSAATRQQPAGSTALAMASGQIASLAANASGQEIFDAVCAQCHTVQPPARTAPPMSHVARHYRDSLPDREQAVDRIAQWLQGPAAERSLLPAHAVEQWGLMPPLALQTRQIRAVADYVWGLADQAMGEGMGMGRGRGMGMGTGQGMQMGEGRGMQMGEGRGMQMGEGQGMQMGAGRGMQMGAGRGMQMGSGHGMQMEGNPMPGQSMEMQHAGHMQHMHHDTTTMPMGEHMMGMQGMGTTHDMSAMHQMGAHAGMMHGRGMMPPDTSAKKD